MRFSIMTLSITNDIQHNDTQHSSKNSTLNVNDTQHAYCRFYYTERRHADCLYAECSFIIVMLSVIRLNVVAPSKCKTLIYKAYMPRCYSDIKLFHS